MRGQEIITRQKAIAQVSDHLAQKFIEICGKEFKGVSPEDFDNFEGLKHSIVFTALVKAVGAYLSAYEFDRKVFEEALTAYLEFDPFTVEIDPLL